MRLLFNTASSQIHSGKLFKLEKSGKKEERYFHAFNDMLVSSRYTDLSKLDLMDAIVLPSLSTHTHNACRPKGGKRLQFRVAIDVTGSSISDVPDSLEAINAFEITGPDGKTSRLDFETGQACAA